MTLSEFMVLLSECGYPARGSALAGGGVAGLKSRGVLSAFGAASVLMGSTALTTMGNTIALPANTLGNNGQLIVTPRWSTNATANAKTLSFYIDGVAICNFNTANNGSVHDQFSIECRNSQQSQVGRGVASVITFGVGPTNAAFAIDFSLPHTLAFKAQLAVGTDTATLESSLIEVINP